MIDSLGPSQRTRKNGLHAGRTLFALLGIDEGAGDRLLITCRVPTNDDG
jgi:hypothetical protein